MKKLFLKLEPFFKQVRITVGVAVKRLLTQRFLSIAAIVGLMIASGFILSIPMYADATYFRLFREELFAGHVADLVHHPVDYAPMKFTFEVNVAGETAPQWQDILPLDEYLTGKGLRELRFPIMQEVRRVHSDDYFLYPPFDPKVPGSQYFLTSADVAFVSPIQQTVLAVHGNYPQPFTSMLDLDSVQAMVSESMADQYGIQIGDEYYLRRDNIEIPVTIVGIWRATDPTAPYWDQSSANWIVVNEESYTNAISEAIPDELRYSMWYIVADGSHLHVNDIAGFDKRIQDVQSYAGTLLGDVKLTSSPLEALKRYQTNAPFLTYLLYAFSVPILGLILAFIGLVTGLFVGQQRGEMAILRSRGASSLQVVGISMLQGVLLGLVALPGGILIGYWIAHAIGRARSFLDFTANIGLRVNLTTSVLAYGILGIGTILLVQVLIPTLSGASKTIVTYKQERARFLHAPWWQRYWVDIIMLIPAGYGLWQLEVQSRQALNGTGNAPNPLQNPLLLIAPAIGIFAVALFTLRLVPHLMNFISWLLEKTKSVGVVMAARFLARSPAFYSAPLVLLLLTLGLSAFTASLAKTLDGQLVKQSSYQVGSDMNLLEMGTTVNLDNSSPTYTFDPVEEHLRIKGVTAATRVGRYSASVLTPTATVTGTFLGIDRATFGKAAYWQYNFASLPLGFLMNSLGANPDGVLVSTDLMKSQHLKLGDKLIFGIQTGVAGESIPMELTVVGTVNLFPTWYPKDGPLFVGNLDNFFLHAGTEYPHEVWLRTTRNADPEGIVYAVRGYSITLDQTADQSKLVENGLNTLVQSWSSTRVDILAEQSRPERQGLFGLLSVGFIASALLTVLGFMLYALFSFRRRFIEMGMLRAIGLSIRQMRVFLAAELASLILLGILAGTFVGILASELFVPFLQIGSTAQAQYPPFQIEIAWFSIIQIYGLFIILFVAALAVLSAVLLRMKIFQAIKLGETS
ncbi:MAG TPA: FtsX-like permease family protein [Anaerolineales bacterium]|nr:FtsX-like permease family protein [Anaerolineales bacterium]